MNKRCLVVLCVAAFAAQGAVYGMNSGVFQAKLNQAEKAMKAGDLDEAQAAIMAAQAEFNKEPEARRSRMRSQQGALDRISGEYARLVASRGGAAAGASGSPVAPAASVTPAAAIAQAVSAARTAVSDRLALPAPVAPGARSSTVSPSGRLALPAPYDVMEESEEGDEILALPAPAPTASASAQAEPKYTEQEARDLEYLNAQLAWIAESTDDVFNKKRSKNDQRTEAQIRSEVIGNIRDRSTNEEVKKLAHRAIRHIKLRTRLILQGGDRGK